MVRPHGKAAHAAAAPQGKPAFLSESPAPFLLSETPPVLAVLQRAAAAVARHAAAAAAAAAAVSESQSMRQMWTALPARWRDSPLRHRRWTRGRRSAGGGGRGGEAASMPVSASSQSAQQMRTALRRDGPDHLGLWVNAGREAAAAADSAKRQQHQPAAEAEALPAAAEAAVRLTIHSHATTADSPPARWP